LVTKERKNMDPKPKISMKMKVLVQFIVRIRIRNIWGKVRPKARGYLSCIIIAPVFSQK
jgi:hypothetical protein